MKDRSLMRCPNRKSSAWSIFLSGRFITVVVPYIWFAQTFVHSTTIDGLLKNASKHIVPDAVLELFEPREGKSK
eukprot:9365852-Prorocentrum_lima.AAC.1